MVVTIANAKWNIQWQSTKRNQTRQEPHTDIFWTFIKAFFSKIKRYKCFLAIQMCHYISNTIIERTFSIFLCYKNGMIIVGIMITKCVTEREPWTLERSKKKVWFQYALNHSNSPTVSGPFYLHRLIVDCYLPFKIMPTM